MAAFIARVMACFVLGTATGQVMTTEPVLGVLCCVAMLVMISVPQPRL